MFFASVNNYIDHMDYITVNDPWLALLWCIAQLRGPCRAGGADIFPMKELVV